MQLSMELRAKEFLFRWEEEIKTYLQMEIPDVEFQKNGETFVLECEVHETV